MGAYQEDALNGNKSRPPSLPSLVSLLPITSTGQPMRHSSLVQLVHKLETSETMCYFILRQSDEDSYSWCSEDVPASGRRIKSLCLDSLPCFTHNRGIRSLEDVKKRYTFLPETSLTHPWPARCPFLPQYIKGLRSSRISINLPPLDLECRSFALSDLWAKQRSITWLLHLRLDQPLQLRRQHQMTQ